MRARNTAPSKVHLRTRDLAAIIDLINLWSMAPADRRRVQALKDALNAYGRAVKAKKYAPTNRNFAMRTGYCNEAPQILPDSFEHFFGAPEENPADNDGPPWNE